MKSFVSSLVLLSLIVLTGCQKGDGNVYVTGDVIYGGQPLPGATVVFTAESASSGEDASGETDEEGRFVLTTVTGKSGSGTKPGEYRVAVTKKNVEWDGVSYLQRAGRDPVPDVKVSDMLPRSYSSYTTTPLRATVTNKKENNVFSFTVE